MIVPSVDNTFAQATHFRAAATEDEIRSTKVAAAHATQSAKYRSSKRTRYGENGHHDTARHSRGLDESHR